MKRPRLHEDEEKNVEPTVVSDAVIARYLLGELPAEEQEAFERRYFGDPELLDRMDAVEDDLIDDYVRNALTPEQRQQFERHFLDPRRRERVRMAEALRRAAPARASRPVWMLPLAAALFVGALLTIVWMAMRERPVAPSPVVAERPAPHVAPSSLPSASPTETAPPPPLQIATIVLSPGLTRGDDTPPALVIAPRTDSVRLEALLEVEAPRYDAVLQRMDGTEVWKGSALTAREGMLVLTIQRDRFRRGEHLLTVTAPDFIADYAFDVR